MSATLLRKAQALLIYLALEPGLHERDALAALLWSDLPAAKARTNLRTVLSRLRPHLADYLNASRRTIGFVPGPDAWVDVMAFEQGVASAVLTVQREALTLYQGEFLAQFSVGDALLFEEWVLFRRERLRSLGLDALAGLAEAALETADYAQATADLRRLLALDPWREAAHRALMRALAASGDRAAALAQFERCRQTLGEDLGVEPALATVALYEQIKAGEIPGTVDDGRWPLIKSGVDDGRSVALGGFAHNLPAQTSPFVGREAELTQIGELLANPDCRLLTLFGPGGMGKTRLALQAARQAQAAFGGGICLVRLEAIETADLLITAIADALTLPLSGKQTPKVQLLAYLQERQMLLLLDNFEHLLPGGDLLVDLLQAAPGLKLLVTSREALNLYEEWLLAVEGLAFPSPESAAAAETFDAISLFHQRARRVDLSFSLAQNETAVIEICRRLWGMPLAIELAAAWVRTIPCPEIARQIAANLDILESSLHNKPARHRSMTAVFDHSWALLRPAERQMACRLAVFQGGFSATAAAEVATATRRDLSALIDKALLRLTAGGRYEFHPLIRQYVADKLAAQPQEEAETKARHSHLFAAFLQAREPHLHDGQQQTVLAEAYQEIENVRAGWQWALAQADTAVLSAYLETMASLYLARSQFSEGQAVVGQAVTVVTGMPDELILTARLLTWQARFDILLGHYDRAENCLRQAVDSVRPLREPRLLGRALAGGLGQLYLRRGELAQSIDYLQEGLPLLEKAQDWSGQAEALLHLSTARSFVAESEQTEVEQALVIYERLGDRMGMIRALIQLGNGHNAQGAYETAVTHYERGLALSREIGDRQTEASCLINLAVIAKRRQEYEKSRELSERSLAIFRETGARLGVAAALNNLGDLAHLSGEPKAAQSCYGESLAIRRQAGDRLGEGLVCHNLGRAALALGDRPLAAAYLKAALTIAADIDSKLLLLQVLVGVAHYLAQGSERARAADILALVGSHPASNQQTREEALVLRERLAGERPLGAAAAGAGSEASPDLSQMVGDLLAEL
ncbi:MAG: BTAD domain-containing putative transcriptional regulator [Chloroflexota bacterium]